VFVDLKATFDSVDKKMLAELLRKREIRKRLMKRMEEVLEEIKSRVKVRDEVGKDFWMGGLRQGCSLSSILFNLLIVNIEEAIGKMKCEGGEG